MKTFLNPYDRTFQLLARDAGQVSLEFLTFMGKCKHMKLTKSAADTLFLRRKLPVQWAALQKAKKKAKKKARAQARARARARARRRAAAAYRRLVASEKQLALERSQLRAELRAELARENVDY